MLVVAAKGRNEVGKNTKYDSCAAKFDEPEEPRAPLKEQVGDSHLPGLIDKKLIRRYANDRIKAQA